MLGNRASPTRTKSRRRKSLKRRRNHKRKRHRKTLLNTEKKKREERKHQKKHQQKKHQPKKEKETQAKKENPKGKPEGKEGQKKEGAKGTEQGAKEKGGEKKPAGKKEGGHTQETGPAADAKKEEPPKGGDQGKKGKSGGKKDAERKPSEKAPAAAVAEASEGKLDDKALKACLKEGGKKGQDGCGMATFGSHFFNSTVESANGNMRLLEKVLEGMNTVVDENAEERKGGAGDLGKMLFNRTETKLLILCHTPPEVMEKATAKEWMAPVLKQTGAKVISETPNIIKAELDNDPDNQVFVFKRCDQGLAASFEFLRSRQLLPDDDDDDDVDYTAGAGINLNAGPGQHDY